MDNERPFFSIIIPTFRRFRFLTQCLEALTQIEFPKEQFEILIVNDALDNLPESIVAMYRRQLQVKLLAQPHAGPAAARNTGSRQARGEQLIFTDDDCLPEKDWLIRLAKRLQTCPDHAIAGRTINQATVNSFACATQAMTDYLVQRYNDMDRQATFAMTSNLSVPRTAFIGVGGFDESFRVAAGEDREFISRWRHLGLGMIYAPEIKVRHNHPLTLAGFVRQHVNYGRGAYHYHSKKMAERPGTKKLEPPAFYLGLILSPLILADRGRGILLSLLLCLAQCCTFWGYYREGQS